LVHVLGARFESTSAAVAALQELRSRYAIDDRDAEIRPLGTTEYDAPTSDLILAARFRPDVIPEVITMLERLGGQVVVERDEWPPPS
jgi:hypothetical protein